MRSLRSPLRGSERGERGLVLAPWALRLILVRRGVYDEGFGPPLLITQVDDRIELIDYGPLSSSGKVL